jgi:hypothetical protein
MLENFKFLNMQHNVCANELVLLYHFLSFIIVLFNRGEISLMLNLYSFPLAFIISQGKNKCTCPMLRIDFIAIKII